MSHQISHIINTDYSITRKKYGDAYDADGNVVGTLSPEIKTFYPQERDNNNNWIDTVIPSTEDAETIALAAFVWTNEAKEHYREDHS